MTKNEKIKRNIGLSFDILREIVNNPKILDSVKDGSNIEFVEKDFIKTESKKLRKQNTIK